TSTTASSKPDSSTASSAASSNASRARPFLNATTPTSRRAAVRGRLLDDAEPAWASLPSYEDASTTAATSATGATATPAARGVSRSVLSEWEEFKRKHNRTYHTRDELKRMASLRRSHGLNTSLDTHHSDEDRMNVFIGRKMVIEEFNKQSKSFKRALNQFADLSPQEVVTKHTGLLLTGRKPKGMPFDHKTSGRLLPVVPRRFDWREKGALTEPRNQATCGCCWAFAATAALEAKNFIRTRRLVPLSEQNLLDCDTLNEKCDGGTPWDAFDWVQFNGGQEESTNYPYEVLPDRCRQDKTRLFRINMRGYMSVYPATEENVMTALVTEGPLAVAVNPNLASFQDYREGVYSDPECSSAEDELRHAMLLVGYGDDPADGPFWTLRNSWGRDWGEGGHIRVARKDNLCGVTSFAVFPVLGDAPAAPPAAPATAAPPPA
ncbi:crustapain-like, partial [Thrips palmi]|uniref:Crustapain-like n=1 Tax=Thrips palmi TaxID=161013 RepID=A0A6P8YF22_THRPL